MLANERRSPAGRICDYCLLKALAAAEGDQLGAAKKLRLKPAQLKQRLAAIRPSDRLRLGQWLAYVNAGRPVELRDELVAAYLPWTDGTAVAVASRRAPWLDRDELLQRVRLALADLVERFEPQRGWRFESFARPRIRGAAMDAIRDAAGTRLRPKRAPMVSLDALIDGSRSDDDHAGLVASRRDRTGKLQALFTRIGRVLSIDEQTLLWLRYAYGYTEAEAAAILQLSESRISQIQSECLARIRAHVPRETAFAEIEEATEGRQPAARAGRLPADC